MNSIFVVGARGIPDVEGGAEKNAERLFPLLAQRGWAVTLAGIKYHLRADSYRGVRLVGVPRSRLLRTDKLLYYVIAIWLVFRHRPAIVHMQGLGAAIMLWAYKLAGARTVVRYGSADYLLPKWGVIGKCGFLAAEFQLRFADAVIAVTPALASRLASRGIRRNVHVIPNAIDTPEDFDASADGGVPSQPYMLAVGRITAQKNVDRLVQGFNLFAKGHDNILLVIVGGIDDPAYGDALAPYLNDRIVLAGRLPRSTLGALYRHATAYVNASIHEGSSNAVLEAMSWNTPILISDIPENRDFGIGDQHYFDPLQPSSLAGAMAQLMARRDDFIVDHGRFLRWDDVADRTSAIYRALGLAPMGAVD